MITGGSAVHPAAAMPDPWLLKFAPRPLAGLRLFCFSSAGSGAAMYRPWLDLLPPQVELCAVQLPGRENRLREAPLASFAELVPAVLAGLRSRLDRPFAFFGHSMGAMLAFELAHALQTEGARLPDCLMVSGRRAPHMPDLDLPMHTLGDDELVAEIGRRYGGIPAEVLEHRDLMALLLPGLRADLTAIETHRPGVAPPLPCPIVAYGGLSDARASTEQLDAWAAHTAASFRRRCFPGGHFYLNDLAVRGQLLGDVAANLPAMDTRRLSEAAE